MEVKKKFKAINRIQFVCERTLSGNLILNLIKIMKNFHNFFLNFSKNKLNFNIS